jgi:hypothetical protein
VTPGLFGLIVCLDSKEERPMPEPTIKRRLANTGDRELADDDGPIFSTVAKLVDALQRAVPHSRDLELREEALRLGRELLRGTKYEEDQ